jgi:PAS domain S-box-containing protein
MAMAPVKNFRSIRYLLLSLIAAIFIGEFLVMWFLDLMPPLLKWQEALFDSTLLLILTFPFLYLWVFRPLKNQLTKLNFTESQRYELSERLRNLARHVPGIVFQFQLRTDGSCALPYANEALLKIYRVNAEDVQEDASSIFKVLHPDDLENHLASIQTSARDLTPWVQEYRLKFPDEQIVWLLGNAIPQRLEDGSTLWHGYVSDITERKLVEKQLSDSENKYRLLIELANDAIFLADAATGVIIDCNISATELIGKAKSEIIGMHQTELHPRDMVDFYQNSFNNHIHS